MIAALRPATVPPLAPVSAALTRMRRRYPVQGLHTPLVVADPAGWLPATGLVDGSGLDDFLAAAGRRWQAPPHVAAALAWKCYAYWTALPAVVGYAAARRVPLLTPDAVLVRYTDRAPFLRLALHDPVVLTGDRDDLLAALRTSLFDAHLSPLVDAIHDRVRLGRRTLLGSLASGIAHGLSRAAGSLSEPTLAVADAILSTLDIADLVELSGRPGGRLHVQRRTCCLAFALPEPRICDGCCIAVR